MNRLRISLAVLAGVLVPSGGIAVMAALANHLDLSAPKLAMACTGVGVIVGVLTEPVAMRIAGRDDGR